MIENRNTEKSSPTKSGGEGNNLYLEATEGQE